MCVCKRMKRFPPQIRKFHPIPFSLSLGLYNYKNLYVLSPSVFYESLSFCCNNAILYNRRKSKKK